MRLGHYYHVDRQYEETVDLPDDFLLSEHERMSRMLSAARHARRRALIEAGQDEEQSWPNQ